MSGTVSIAEQLAPALEASIPPEESPSMRHRERLSGFERQVPGRYRLSSRGDLAGRIALPGINCRTGRCMMLKFAPVTAENWDDFERFFESRGSPHYCWCMAWRSNEFKKMLPGKAGKKASMKSRVASGTPIGILCYRDDEPVAWCSIAPRASYRPLGGDETLDRVWSLVCFFVHRQFRNKGVSMQLLQAAIAEARSQGARYVEAYPVEPDSTTYRFMGLVPAFEEAGFRFVKPAGTRRKVMILPVEDNR